MGKLTSFLIKTFLIGSIGLNAQVDPIFIGNLPLQIDESSGLDITENNSYWTHNDTDNDAILFNIDANGNLQDELSLQGINQVDLEDVAYDGEIFFYIGDFGNNLNDRTDLKIYRIPNPDLLSGTANPEVINFTLSDQTAFPPNDANFNFDIETMFFFNGNLHLFSRNRTDPFDGNIKHYRLNPTPGNHVAELVNTFFGNLSPNHSSITAGDINPSGTRVALLSNSSIFIFKNFPNDDFFSGELSYNFFNSTKAREGICFRNNCEVLISQEGDDLGNPGQLEELNTCDIVLNQDQIGPFLFESLINNKILSLRSSNAMTLLQIHDLKGRLIYEESNLNYFEHSTNLSYLNSGIYIGSITFDNEKSQSFKLFLREE